VPHASHPFTVSLRTERFTAVLEETLALGFVVEFSSPSNSLAFVEAHRVEWSVLLASLVFWVSLLSLATIYQTYGVPTTGFLATCELAIDPTALLSAGVPIVVMAFLLADIFDSDWSVGFDGRL
jgi:hypothetical protein